MRDLLLRCLVGTMRVSSSLAPPEAAPAPGVDTPALAAWRERNTDRHPSPEFLLALSGRANCRLNDQRFIIGAGDWVVFADGDVHDNGYPPGAEAAAHVWIRCGADTVTWNANRIGPDGFSPAEGMMYDLGDARFAVWLRHEIDHLRLAARAADESAVAGVDADADLATDAGAVASIGPLSSPETAEAAAASAAMRARHLRGVLACLAGRMHERVMAKPPLAGGERRTRAVQLARRWIEETHGAGLTVDAVARHAGYNPFYFMRLFKETTGLTVKECIENEQAAHCRRRLAEGIAKKRIAAELGFSSPAAFSHWLRRQG